MKFKTLLAIVMCALFSYKSTAQEVRPSEDNGKKTLVVYLTRTENTKQIAQQIHNLFSGDLVEIETVNTYPENYQDMVNRVQWEQDNKFKPELKTKIENIKDYDVIFVGFPTWGMELPAPMRTFLTEYDFSGKTIIPFCTHGGGGQGNSFNTVKELLPNANILKGFSIIGGNERDGEKLVIQGDNALEANEKVKEWLKDINIIE